MPATTNPELLITPLAKNAEKNVIPETTGATTGLFSQDLGFQEINSTPLTAGGKAPDRKDFNGVFNLLGGVAFYAQKGWTFHYDSSQDYYLGCLVIDPADGKRYECIADMAAGTVAPHEDTDGDYWRRYTLGDYEQELAGKANITGSNLVHHRDVITTSGTYTAPVTGLYKITVKGGGGGGRGGSYYNSYKRAGVGGGEGGTTIAFAHMTIGDTATVVIGAGGAGGTASTTAYQAPDGENGGSSTITIGATTYTGGGGVGGSSIPMGGSGTIPGAPGTIGDGFANVNAALYGGAGGGAGASIGGGHALNGAGGAGGSVSTSNTPQNGNAGANGFVTFEYYTPGA